MHISPRWLQGSLVPIQLPPLATPVYSPHSGQSHLYKSEWHHVTSLPLLNSAMTSQYSKWIKSKVLSMSYGIFHGLIHTYLFYYHFPPYTPHLVTQLSQRPCLFSNTPSPVPPVGLLTCFSLCLEHSYCRTSQDWLLLITKVSTQYHVFRECSLTILPKISPPLHHSHTSYFQSSLSFLYSIRAIITICDSIIYGASWLYSRRERWIIISMSALHITVSPKRRTVQINHLQQQRIQIQIPNYFQIEIN